MKVIQDLESRNEFALAYQRIETAVTHKTLSIWDASLVEMCKRSEARLNKSFSALQSEVNQKSAKCSRNDLHKMIQTVTLLRDEISPLARINIQFHSTLNVELHNLLFDLKKQDRTRFPEQVKKEEAAAVKTAENATKEQLLKLEHDKDFKSVALFIDGEMSKTNEKQAPQYIVEAIERAEKHFQAEYESLQKEVSAEKDTCFLGRLKKLEERCKSLQTSSDILKKWAPNLALIANGLLHLQKCLLGQKYRRLNHLVKAQEEILENEKIKLFVAASESMAKVGKEMWQHDQEFVDQFVLRSFERLKPFFEENFNVVTSKGATSSEYAKAKQNLFYMLLHEKDFLNFLSDIKPQINCGAYAYHQQLLRFNNKLQGADEESEWYKAYSTFRTLRLEAHRQTMMKWATSDNFKKANEVLESGLGAILQEGLDFSTEDAFFSEHYKREHQRVEPLLEEMRKAPKLDLINSLLDEIRPLVRVQQLQQLPLYSSLPRLQYDFVKIYYELDNMRYDLLQTNDKVVAKEN